MPLAISISSWWRPTNGVRNSAIALVAEAKRLSPDRITLLVNSDNARAIRFYERNGFVHAGEDVNPTSGRPVLRMEWKAKQRRSPMTRTELATGSATFIAVAAAGWLSATALDRHFAAAVDNDLASGDRNQAAQTPSSTACVGADGSWKNWVWANVPMLSPKCGD